MSEQELIADQKMCVSTFILACESGKPTLAWAALAILEARQPGECRRFFRGHGLGSKKLGENLALGKAFFRLSPKQRRREFLEAMAYVRLTASPLVDMIPWCWPILALLLQWPS